MEDPVQRRMRLHGTKGRKRETPEMQTQMRAFRKGSKIPISRDNLQDIKALQGVIAEVKGLEDRLRDLSAFEAHFRQPIEDAKKHLAFLQNRITELEKEIASREHEAMVTSEQLSRLEAEYVDRHDIAGKRKALEDKLSIKLRQLAAMVQPRT